MKNDKQPSGWKNELLSGLVELAFYVICGAVGLGILFLLPDEMTENTPFELFCTLGCFVVIAIGVIVGWIANMRKTKKQVTTEIYDLSFNDAYIHRIISTTSFVA